MVARLNANHRRLFHDGDRVLTKNRSEKRAGMPLWHRPGIIVSYNEARAQFLVRFEGARVVLLSFQLFICF